MPARVVRDRVADARKRAAQEAIWAEEGRQHKLRQAERQAAIDAGLDPDAVAAAPPSEAEQAAASVAEEAATAAGLTAPVDPAEQSDLPMARRS